jgi:hypothetical protein
MLKHWSKLICSLIASYFPSKRTAAKEAVKKNMQNSPRDWRRVELSRNNQLSILGYTNPFFSKDEQRLFPYRVIIAYEYDKKGSNRLPNTAESQRIEGYEAAIRSNLSKDNFGVLAATLASDGLYQLIAYVEDGVKGEFRLIDALPNEKRTKGEPFLYLEFNSKFDRSWKYVTPMMKRVSNQQ